MERAKALFLDRDGVINVDRGYVHRVADFVFIDGVFEACRQAVALDYTLVIVTNQSGIGRGLFTEDAFQSLTHWMLEKFRGENIEMAAVYHDPTHPVHGRGAYRRVSPDRKPAPGMLLRARDALGLDLSRSVMVGDAETDVAAGRAAGVAYNVLISPLGRPSSTAADVIMSSLKDTTHWLSGKSL